jgi:hypothetical protein
MPIMIGSGFLEIYQQLLLPVQQANIIVMLTTCMASCDLACIKELPHCRPYQQAPHR